mmetsp:Transcript_7124/g.20147  ORF Transcript_7124/g.20147 Transcript_7124/m.20147 type:complete len:258 (-) Transcript_7124:384-1157(-)
MSSSASDALSMTMSVRPSSIIIARVDSTSSSPPALCVPAMAPTSPPRLRSFIPRPKSISNRPLTSSMSPTGALSAKAAKVLLPISSSPRLRPSVGNSLRGDSVCPEASGSSTSPPAPSSFLGVAHPASASPPPLPRGSAAAALAAEGTRSDTAVMKGEGLGMYAPLAVAAAGCDDEESAAAKEGDAMLPPPIPPAPMLASTSASASASTAAAAAMTGVASTAAAVATSAAASAAEAGMGANAAIAKEAATSSFPRST